MTQSEISRSYYEYHTPCTIDPATLLRNLLRHNILSEPYMMYNQQDELWIAGDPLASVWVDTQSISSDLLGQRRSIPAIDPFAQISAILADLPLESWRAYGYVGFDMARFYYPYHKAMNYPLMHLFIPALEMHLAQQMLHIRSIEPLDRFQEAFLARSDEPRDYVAATPTIERYEGEEYRYRVKQLVQAINAGELHKAIIARRVKLKGNIDIPGTYDFSAAHNNAVRSYCLAMNDIHLVGFSPEILMQVDTHGLVTTNPLAGTRPRGSDTHNDRLLEQELFTDAKEVKEHAISIWLAQQEIDSVCVDRSARVIDFMEVKKYRTVQHLSSRVVGQLKPGNTLWHALKALFPGITVSGIGKIEAMTWIDQLEDEPRGIYAGGIGWVDSSGAADLALGLRSIFQYGDTICFNAGAGIVGESRPEFEYTETMNKMQTMLNYLVLSER